MKKVFLGAVMCLYSATSLAEILTCRWEPTNAPSTVLQYNSRTRVAHTWFGWDYNMNRPIYRKYDGVVVMTGLPPYGRKGTTLVYGGEIPIASVRLTYNGSNWQERGTKYPFEAYWATDRSGRGLVPGNPKGGIFGPLKGFCFTKSRQGKQRTND